MRKFMAKHSFISNICRVKQMSLKSYNPLTSRHDLLLSNIIRTSKCSIIPDLKKEILKFSTDIGIFQQFFKTPGKSKQNMRYRRIHKKNSNNNNNDSSSDEEDEMSTIIIDNGTAMIKSGFGGDDAPRAVFPTVVGRPRHTKLDIYQKSYFVGDEAQSKRGILNLKWCLKEGIIQDWDSMGKVWEHNFYNEMRVDPSEHSVIITEKAGNSFENRKKITKIMFEKFKVPQMFIVSDPILSLYASGRQTGVVINCGEDITHIVPVFEGYCIPYGIKTLNLGGKHITDYMMKLFSERGYSFTTSAEREIVRDTKEKLGYVATDYDKEIENAERESHIDKNYELPDGQVITVETERFVAPEALFQPNLIGLESDGLSKLTYDSIMACEKPIMQQLFGNILLSGGSTMFPNMDMRLVFDITKLQNDKIKIISPPERKYSVWIGASIVSDRTSFDKYWVNKSDYEEIGTNIVYRHYV